MISDIRSYFRSQIISVDSELVENPSAFYYQDIPETIIDRSYQIEINNINNLVRNSHFEDFINVKVCIFGFGYRDEIENYDCLLDKAICIRNNIIDLRNFTGKFTISDIRNTSIASSQLPGDDNGFKIDMDFTLTAAYSTEE